MASKAQSVPVPRWVNSYSRLPHTSATDDDSTIISSISAGDAPLYLDPVELLTLALELACMLVPSLYQLTILVPKPGSVLLPTP